MQLKKIAALSLSAVGLFEAVEGAISGSSVTEMPRLVHGDKK